MGEPNQRQNRSAARIERLAAAVRTATAAGEPFRIGSYLDADESEREVAIVRNARAEWEVHDRGGDSARPVENLGDALEEAIAVALEYLRDTGERAVRARAIKLAAAVVRRRAALAAGREYAPVSARRAA
jgi:hypothetical protein